jgi:hypothetical protein
MHRHAQITCTIGRSSGGSSDASNVLSSDIVYLHVIQLTGIKIHAPIHTIYTGVDVSVVYVCNYFML